MLLICCTSKHDNNVFLFNDISFKLIDGEEVVTIDSIMKETFISFFDDKTVQVPLFRCIKADSYLIFIGIPFNTSVKELAHLNLSQSLQQTFFESDSINYFYKAFHSEFEFITVYTKSFDNNLVYVLTTSNIALLSDSLFNMEAISNRFNE